VTVFVGVITAVIAGFFPLSTVAELVNMGTLVAFSIVALGVIVLRYQQPGLERPFRCPWVPVVPLLCMGCCIFLIACLNTLSHQLFVIWLFIGLAVYFLYGVKHSTNRQNGTVLQPEPIPCRINPESPLPGIAEIGSPDARADMNQ
jgi:APA family basic amino acid/polyamine antiporter